jgi:hypothetical protein
MLLSVERPFVGAFAFHIPGAMLLHLMVWCKQSCRRRLNMGKRTIGVPQELVRSCRFLSEIPAGATGSPTPGLGGALVRRGANKTSER